MTREVKVGNVTIYTSIEEIAECLEELNMVLLEGTAENRDMECVFRAYKYLRDYQFRRPGVAEILRRFDEILIRDLKSGKIKLW